MSMVVDVLHLSLLSDAASQNTGINRETDWEQNWRHGMWWHDPQPWGYWVPIGCGKLHSKQTTIVWTSPFEFPLQNGRPCAPFQGLARLKIRWKNGDGPGILYRELGNCILCIFNVSVVERPLKIESHFVAREFAHRKTTCKNPISFCSKGSCPSEGTMWKPNLIL